MKQKVDKVIVLWTANTEMFMLPEIQTIEELDRKIDSGNSLPASVLFAVAAIQEKIKHLTEVIEPHCVVE